MSVLVLLLTRIRRPYMVHCTFESQGTGDREQFGKTSGLGVPDAARFQTASIAEDKTPYLSTPMSRREDSKHEWPRKTLADTSLPRFPLGSYPTTSTKHRAKASLRLVSSLGG